MTEPASSDGRGGPATEAGFDAFYRATRERVLLSTYALTGDRSAATNAVREAYAVAWQRRHRTARRERPETAVREAAWTSAYRRHGARLWHRDQQADAQLRTTLDALARLTGRQRRVLLLTHLAGASLDETAAEVGLSRQETARQLELATAALTGAGDAPSGSVDTALAPLETVLEDVAWPDPATLRRSGTNRRRARTAAGVLGTAAVLVVSGLFVADPSGLRPTVAGALDGDAPAAPGSGGPGPVEESEGGELAPEEVELLPRSTLLDAAALDRLGTDEDWRVRRTSDNSAGNGLVLPCQQERYLDPDGQAALVREFRGTAPSDDGLRASAVQVSEVSRTAAGARRAYRAVVSSVGACTEPRTQLLATRSLEETGDRSLQLVLRSWGAQGVAPSTSVVQVSRTGLVTTATSTTYAGAGAPDVRAFARLQASAVTGVCGVRGAGTCVAGSAPPELIRVSPPPAGVVPALIGEVDLPPVSGVDQPWVGTDPRRARTNAASTGCDGAAFRGRFEGAPWRQARTRTFLVPEADLPPEFGLTETLGSLPTAQARAFVEQIRTDLAACPDGDLGTQVDEVASLDQGETSLTAWQLTTEVSDQRSIRFSMAVLRQGTSVAQLGFVPTPRVSMRDGAFVALAERALVRLESLPQRPGPRANERRDGAATGDRTGRG